MFCSTVIESYECYTHSNWKYLDIKRPYSIIYYIIDGTGYYKIGDKTELFKKGHLYIFPANVPYSLYDDENDKLYQAYVHAFIHPEIKQLVDLDVEKDEFLKTVIGMLRKYIAAEIPQSPNVYTQKITEMLVSYISEIEKENNVAVYTQVKRYLDKNYVEVFKGEKLSEAFGYSNSQINKIFKDAYNITPNQYCVNLVLKHIVNLLRSGVPVKEVSNLLDFSSPASFSRFFKTNYGYSPSDFVKGNK